MGSAWRTAAAVVRLAFLVLVTVTSVVAEDEGPAFRVDLPSIVLTKVPFEVSVARLVDGGAGGVDEGFAEKVILTLVAAGADEPRLIELAFASGSATQKISIPSSGRIELSVGDSEVLASARCLPGYFSILPPLVAILLALLFRHVLVALFAGIWLGAAFVVPGGVVKGFLAVVDRYVIAAVADSDHASIIVFTMLLGGMVGVMTKSGGTQGIVESLAVKAKSSRAGQLTAWVLGLVVFFDDYANTLIVGNTMRPITDRLKISREKLAYIVDSTAAPVASIALISTWIGTEVGLIGDAMASLPAEHQGDPYGVFLQSIVFRFYPLLALVFGFIVAATGRDLFSMARAEQRAATKGELYRVGADLASGGENEIQEPDSGAPCRWFNAVIPILTVIVVTMIGLYITGVADAGEPKPGEGLGARIREIIGKCDSYKALLWASFSGAFVAVLLAFGQRILGVGACMKALTSGFKAMLPAVLILVLAWSLAAVTKELGAADYLLAALSGVVKPQLLPLLVFLTAALVSFATGSSWGTMGILIPLVVPLAYGLGTAAGMDAEGIRLVILGAISSVLAGAVFGDHCSPISDTTIMSSMATGCDHIDHVRTQLPYAVLVGLVAILIGDLPSAYGVSPWICLLLGAGILYGVLRLFGKKVGVSGS